MRKYEIIEQEGMRQVQVTLDNETIRAEAGALSHMQGDIVMDSSLLPSARGLLAAYLSDESMFRPTYTGTGKVVLEPTMGGYHFLDLAAGEAWILAPGSYWASDSSVKLTVFREKMITAFWAGEGLFYFQTIVEGPGTAVLRTSGPVQEVSLDDSRLAADSNQVIARTKGIRFSIRRATRTWLGQVTSGEGYVRCFEGTGRLLMSPVPYWRNRFMASMAK